jgi:hypothetical protein
VGTQRHRAVHNRRIIAVSCGAYPAGSSTKISVLGLPFLLEGTLYDVARVTQLLGLVGSEDWTGYEQVGALPIQLVGTDGHGRTVACPGKGLWR